MVSAGLIDSHVHVYEHCTPLGVAPDTYGVQRGVTTVVDVEDYGALLEEIKANGGEEAQTTLGFRKKMAQIAYARTGAYDAAVSTWMAGAIGETTPRRRVFAGELKQTMRYGENPHQKAAFYTDGSNRPGVAVAEQWPCGRAVAVAKPLPWPSAPIFL